MGEPISNAERDALAALGYTEAWITSGILDRRLLAEQAARLAAGGSKKTAKARAAAVSAWLAGAGPIPDAQLDAFLALVAADPDAKLAQSAVAELLRSPRLSLAQLERIAEQDPKLVKRHEALVRRAYLTRRLDEGVTDELLGRVLELGDASVQTALVRDPRLTRKQAERLAKQGANPTIRQQAEAWVRDKKAWS